MTTRMVSPVGETYIVRIYRRDQKQPDRIVGVVEKVSDRKEHAFRTVRELTDVIVGRPRRTVRRKHRPPSQ